MNILKNLARTLLAFILIFAVSGIAAVFASRKDCSETKGYSLPDDLYVDFTMFSYYVEEELSPGYVVRHHYFVGKEGAEPLLYADSFGLETDDCCVDIDGDGCDELLCNNTYGGDGDRELYVYKARDGYIWEGTVNWTGEDLPGLDEYGSCAVMTRYAPEISKIVVDYDVGHGPRKQRYFDFDRLNFELKIEIGTFIQNKRGPQRT